MLLYTCGTWSKSFRLPEPCHYLNYYTWQDTTGRWQRSRAVTLAVYMRDQQQIAKFGASVDNKLEQLKHILPQDFIIARTSDQPMQVKENIDLLMRALFEAIILVVVVSLIGFWEWRSGAHHGSGNSYHAGHDIWNHATC